MGRKRGGVKVGRVRGRDGAEEGERVSK